MKSTAAERKSGLKLKRPVRRTPAKMDEVFRMVLCDADGSERATMRVYLHTEAKTYSDTSKLRSAQKKILEKYAKWLAKELTNPSQESE